MPRIFAITTPHDSVKIKPDNSSKGVSFTVTNNSDRPLRAQIKLRAQDETNSSWLKIAGEETCELKAGGTEQVAVNVQVPPGTEPGKYTFRIDVVSIANPDEDYTEGPSVKLEVLLTAGPKPSFPWWILVLLAILLAVGGTVGWILWRKEDTPEETQPPAQTQRVPKVIGLSWPAAQEQLQAKNFKADYQLLSAGIPDGKVVSQDPPPDALTDLGTTISLGLVAAYGPDTCLQGYVWRDAFEDDRVCVTPETRSQAANDNSQASARRNPSGGAYGPDTCLQGYVWRDAFEGDHVCVTPETRSQAANDNSQAASRRVIP